MLKKQITKLEDVRLLVNSFYDKVREDKFLAPIFNERIGDKWPEHLEKMYRFWQTVLLAEHTYMGSPFPPHARLAIEHTHFERWLQLFTETLEEYFAGEKAEEAKWRAQKMAEMFQYKIARYQATQQKPLI
ncbi:group III truncated hemoglobin [Porifericola rhodea]|nr:group III truncated hemoglobin [Porifericola rhodea]WKN33940.1 group III truncated hemoglobin [Porifericola rhodea]